MSWLLPFALALLLALTGPALARRLGFAVAADDPALALATGLVALHAVALAASPACPGAGSSRSSRSRSPGSRRRTGPRARSGPAAGALASATSWRSPSSASSRFSPRATG